jgi:hypothetical protein
MGDLLQVSACPAQRRHKPDGNNILRIGNPMLAYGMFGRYGSPGESLGRRQQLEERWI